MLQNLIVKETKRNPVKNTLKRNNKQFECIAIVRLSIRKYMDKHLV